MVGAVIGSNQIDNVITNLAISLRNVMRQMSNLSLAVNGQGNGLTYLESIGYASAANAANPGGISDAQYALNMIGYLNTMAAVYYGTAAQTPAFNFDQELSQMWAGQVSG